MKMTNGLAAAALVAGLSIAAPASAAVTYSNTGTAGLTSPAGVVSYLEAFTPTGTGANTLSAMTFGLGVAAGTAATTQVVYIDFYKGVDLSPTAANALANASYVGGFGGTINITANTGTTTAFRAFSFSNLNTLATPVTFQQDGSNFGIVVTATDSTGQFYSTILSGLFNSNGPTIGTAYNYVWNDANLNGTFAGSEQTRFGSANPVYTYLSLTTVAAATAVPEPASWAMMIAGFGLVGGAMRRRAVKTTVSFA